MFRFTIRDLLWLVVVVGLTVGWLLDRREVARWRGITGGLQHMLGGLNFDVGVTDGRVWLSTRSRPRYLLAQTGIEEHAPSLKNHAAPPPEELESYYDTWPRNPAE